MMSSQKCEVLIVGAGPAGLGAARTAARLGFRTLVLDRLNAAGDLSYPCGAMIAPVPGFVSAQRSASGIRFAGLDLSLPSSLIAGYPTVQRLVGPSGQEFSAPYSSSDDFPLAVVDKPGLLRLLAAQAEAAGAELRFGTAAIGLVQDGGRVTGVRTGGGAIQAEVVLSAEGTARQLCEEAGLYARVPPAKRYAFVVSQDLFAPAVTAEHLGQLVTLGRRYTSAQQAFGTVVLPAPGRASVYFTIFADGARYHTDRSLWYFLDEYMQSDPRVKDLFVGSQVIGGSTHKLVMRDAPVTIAQDGFLGLGDATTPGGHLGIIPSLYLGRQAALLAAEALDSGDVSRVQFQRYQQLFQDPILSSLEAERKLILGLMRMSDQEIDRLCETLHALRLTAPFFGTWRTIAWEAVGWFVKQFPLVARDWELLERVLSEPEFRRAPSGNGRGKDQAGVSVATPMPH